MTQHAWEIIAALLASWLIVQYQKKRAATKKKIQTQLFQAEKLAALGELIGGVAHEINTPVSIMTARIGLMIDDAKTQHLPQCLIADLETLRKQTSRIGHLVQNLLTFSRKSREENVTINLNDLVKETMPLIAHEIEKKGIAVEFYLTENLPAIKGNANELQQVLLNLLINARDALLDRPAPARKTKIQIATWTIPEAHCVRLCVVDNGCGIKERDASYVFNPFFTTKKTGTGLGLSISQGIIKNHGGALTIANSGTQKACGTCFAITLPIDKTKAAP